MKKQRCCYCRLIHLAATFRMLHRTNLCWNGNDCGGQYLPGRMMMGGRHHGHFFQIFQSYPVLPQQQRLRRTRRGKAFAPKISLLRTKFDGKGRVTFGKRGANKFFCIQYWWLLLILVISMRDLVSAAEVFLSFGACMPKCQRSTRADWWSLPMIRSHAAPWRLRLIAMLVQKCAKLQIPRSSKSPKLLIPESGIRNLREFFRTKAPTRAEVVHFSATRYFQLGAVMRTVN